MATQLDLQEQEQLDDIKHFWKQYGSLITWTLIIALAVFSAWNGWQWWQRDQAMKAGAMFDELDRVAQGGDAARAAQIFNELKERYPRTLFTDQGGLLAAEAQLNKGNVDGAQSALAWVAEHANQSEYRSIARLRLAGVLLDAKKYDEALKQLDAIKDDKHFRALAADRRGDVMMAQGKKDEARAAYQAAWKGLDPAVAYRRLVEAKLISLGADPTAPGGANEVAAAASQPAAAGSAP